MRRRGRRDAEWVADILKAIARIERWRTSHDQGDDMFRSAVLRELGVIGEAVNALSDGFKAARPGIPWRSVADLRNVLVHHYWDTAWALIEQVLDDDLGHMRQSVADARLAPVPAPAPDIVTSSSPPRSDRCSCWMPKARAYCVLRTGHAGGCRSR